MDDKTDRGRAVLILGAGAPHSPLMAGALCAIWEAGKTFDTIWTAGAGGLIGMLFAAPKNRNPAAALRSVVDAGVDDAIYRFFPVDFKVFYKPGPFTQLFRYWARMCHLPEPGWPSHPGWPGHSGHPGHPGWPGPPWPPFSHAWRRLYNDWIDFWFSALTPTTLNYFSEGMCDPLPFLEEMVDCDALKHFPGDFYLNAYNITADRVDQFDKDELTPLHVRAGLACPFIYPPVTIGTQLYYEGADRQPIPSTHFTKIKNFGDTGIVVIMDILSSLEPALVRRPRNLWDAYNISIVTPIVSLATRDVERFKNLLESPDIRNIAGKLHQVSLRFTIPVADAPYLLEWSHSNLRRLWDIGYETGERFLERYADDLPPRLPIPRQPIP